MFQVCLFFEKLIFYNWKLVLLLKLILFWLCLYLSGKWLHILCILFIRYNFIYMADETMAAGLKCCFQGIQIVSSCILHSAKKLYHNTIYLCYFNFFVFMQFCSAWMHLYIHNQFVYTQFICVCTIYMCLHNLYVFAQFICDYTIHLCLNSLFVYLLLQTIRSQ